jgi:hypothetical protein
LGGLKRNCGFGSALRTDGPGFGTHTVSGSRYALDFALFAPLRIVLELFVVKEQLFTGGKDEVVTAIRTLEYLVNEIHYASPRACLGNLIFHQRIAAWHRLTNQLVRLP